MKTGYPVRPFLTALALTVLMGTGPTMAVAACGDFNGDGNTSAADALGVLRAAVGQGSCDLVRCDVDSNGAVAASDALRVLQGAVGAVVVLDCPGVAVNSIDDLPRATGAVVGEVVQGGLVYGGLAYGGLAYGGAAALGTTTGISLADTSNAFGSTSSMAACEFTNMTRIALTSAAEADKMLCYIQNTFAGIEQDPANPVDIYDGLDHVFELAFAMPEGMGSGGPGQEEMHGGPARVKMRLVRGDDGTISGFNMFACEEDAQGGLSQNEYVSQTIDNTEFTMLAKGMFSDPWGGGTNSHQVQVTGSLNDAGEFVGSKSISMGHSSSWPGGGSGFGEMVAVQGTEQMDITGYDAGGYGEGEWARTYSHSVIARAELLDNNTAGTAYEIGNLAVGHGAAKVSMRDGTQYEWNDFTRVEGWDGDTREVDYDVSEEFVDYVVDAEVPEALSSLDIVFSQEESWDCSDPTEAVVSVDMMALDQQCSHLEIGREWLNCFDLVQGVGGTPGDPGPGGEYCDPVVDPNCF